MSRVVKLNMRRCKTSPHFSKWFGRVCFLTPLKGSTMNLFPLKTKVLQNIDCQGVFTLLWIRNIQIKQSKSSTIMLLLLGCIRCSYSQAPVALAYGLAARSLHNATRWLWPSLQEHGWVLWSDSITVFKLQPLSAPKESIELTVLVFTLVSKDMWCCVLKLYLC